MIIPIRNIYFLLLYAWNVLDEADSVDVREEDPNTLVDLFASVLHKGLMRLLKRGLDRSYIAKHDCVSGVQGKLDVSASIKTRAFDRASSICEFDDLSHDVLHNRILKTTVARLVRLPELDEEVRRDLILINRRMSDVLEIPLSRDSFRSVQLHGNIRSYRLLLDICRILHRHVTVDETTGSTTFRDFSRDERAMRRLFERFVFKFYKHEQHQYLVRRDRLAWYDTNGYAADIDKLPLLNTDVSLVSQSRKLIVETKYVPNLFQTHYGKQTFRSGHIYQLFAYLRNIAAQDLANGCSRAVDGLLLYPRAVAECDMSFSMHGHRIRIATVDLTVSSSSIRQRLLSLI